MEDAPMDDRQLEVIRHTAVRALAYKNFKTQEVHVDSTQMSDGRFTFMGIPVLIRGDLEPGEAFLVTPGREPIRFDL